MSNRRFFLLLAAGALFIILGLAVYWLLTPKRSVSLASPLAGLGDSVGLTVEEYQPSLFLGDGKLLKDRTKPAWFDAYVLPMLTTPLPYETFVHRAGVQFVKDSKITRAHYDMLSKDTKRDPYRETIFFATHVESDFGEYVLVAALPVVFQEAPPSDHEGLALSAVRKIDGTWRPYRLSHDSPLLKIPWNNRVELERIIASGQAHIGKYEILVAGAR